MPLFFRPESIIINYMEFDIYQDFVHDGGENVKGILRDYMTARKNNVGLSLQNEMVEKW